MHTSNSEATDCNFKADAANLVRTSLEAATLEGVTKLQWRRALCA